MLKIDDVQKIITHKYETLDQLRFLKMDRFRLQLWIFDIFQSKKVHNELPQV